MAITTTVITMVTIATMGEDMGDMDWHSGWDYWVTAWALMEAEPLLMDMRLITGMHQIMGMRPWLQCRRHHPFTSSSNHRSYRFSLNHLRLKHLIIGIIAVIRKATIPI